MTGNEYQQKAMRTSNFGTNKLLEAVLGMCGEAGECSDMVKKSKYQGHEFDKEHFARELGDVLWYIALGAKAIGYPLEEIMRMNIQKLEARYPNGFEEIRSAERMENDT